MRNLFEKALYEKYPKIFADKDKAENESPISQGIECDNGWFVIIDTLCNNIQKHIDTSFEERELAIKFNTMKSDAVADNWLRFDEWYKNPRDEIRESYKKRLLEASFQEVKDPVPQVVVEQIKEKFGTLRFYYRGGDDHVRNMVAMVEDLSSRTCEVCGSPGRTREGSWVRTLCDEHASES